MLQSRQAHVISKPDRELICMKGKGSLLYMYFYKELAESKTTMKVNIYAC